MKNRIIIHVFPHLSEKERKIEEKEGNRLEEQTKLKLTKTEQDISTENINLRTKVTNNHKSTVKCSVPYVFSTILVE